MNISTVQRKSDISLSFQRATAHMQSSTYAERYAIARPSVRHTGGSVRNKLDYAIFTI